MQVLTYTCDRCGLPITAEVNRSEIVLTRGLVIFLLPSSRPTMDLCDVCARSFQEWLETKPEPAEEVRP